MKKNRGKVHRSETRQTGWTTDEFGPRHRVTGARNMREHREYQHLMGLERNKETPAHRRSKKGQARQVEEVVLPQAATPPSEKESRQRRRKHKAEALRARALDQRLSARLRAQELNRGN